MQIQTVLGPIGLDELGRTLMHEHLFIAFPGAEFDPTATFDRPAFIAEAVRRLTQLRVEHGVRSFLDPCPIELGRDAAMMAEIAEQSEMNVVCTTGFYFEAMGLPVYGARARWTRSPNSTSAKSPTASAVPACVPARSRSPRCAGDHAAGGGVPRGRLHRAARHRRADHHPHAGRRVRSRTAGGVPRRRRGAASLPDRPLLRQRRSRVSPSCLRGRIVYRLRPHRAGTVPAGRVRADNLVKLVRAGYRASIMMSQDRHCGWLGKLLRQLRRRNRRGWTGCTRLETGRRLTRTCSPTSCRCCASAD